MYFSVYDLPQMWHSSACLKRFSSSSDILKGSLKCFLAVHHARLSQKTYEAKKDSIDAITVIWSWYCYGKIYWFFCAFVWSIFICKLSHLTISNLFEFIQVLSFAWVKKCIKTTVAFGIDFCCYSLSSYAPACRHFFYLLLFFFS